MTQKLPRTVGRYRIRELVGRGAMGAVYRAEDPEIRRDVAVKIFTASELGDGPAEEEARHRFLREAQIAGRLAHPNIVTVYDVGQVEDGGAPYIAMEFVRGESLSAMAEAGRRFTPEGAARIVRQVADALDYAHAQGVTHRDIKPGNLLLMEGGTVKVTDFGVARAGPSELTRTGQVMGTPYYMSPEQVKGEEADGRSDLFALGVVYYLLLTGERPFTGDSLAALSYKIAHTDPALPSTLHPELPEGHDAVIARLLAKEKEERFQRGAEVASALTALLDDSAPARPDRGSPFRTTLDAYPGSKRRWWPARLPLWAVGAVGAVLLLLAGALLWPVFQRWGASEPEEPPVEAPVVEAPREEATPRVRPKPVPRETEVPAESLVAPEEPAPVVTAAPATVHYLFRHGQSAGILRLLVDGEAVAEHALEAPGRLKKQEIRGTLQLKPGSHTIGALLDVPGKDALESSEEGIAFRSEEQRYLHLDYAKLFGARALNQYWDTPRALREFGVAPQERDGTAAP